MQINIDDKLLPAFLEQAQQKKQDLDQYLNFLLSQLEGKITQQSQFKVSIKTKIKLAKLVIAKALREYGSENVCVAWTGGKDSTLILEFVRAVVKEENLEMPETMFINEGHIFEEIAAFVKEWQSKWKLVVHEVQNTDVSSKAKKVGDPVIVAELDEVNRTEVKRLGYKEKTFPFEPESYVGNHLMKTVAMNRFLSTKKFKAVITGIRWDEQDARATETYFSPRGDKFTPAHTRIHPILHFTEKEIWEAIMLLKVPFCSLYKEGYRSLGAKGTTKKAGSKPAWEQDFDKVKERAGRRQDKEGIMANLRKLGYM